MWWCVYTSHHHRSSHHPIVTNIPMPSLPCPPCPPQGYPPNLHALTNLQHLGIAQVSEFIPILPPLPDSISCLQRLESLIIEGAAFADGYPHCVRALTGLSQLVLRGEWGMIAPPIEGLTRLHWLEICAGILDPQVCD